MLAGVAAAAASNGEQENEREEAEEADEDAEAVEQIPSNWSLLAEVNVEEDASGCEDSKSA